jgi:hypothetical protein
MRSLGADGRDVDLDGDYDLLVAEDSDINELFLENITQIADVTAPRAEHLEQAPNRAAGPPPTVVRVHVYDNSSWDVARHDTVSVEYSWNAGADWHSAPMRYGGGQLFRGEIRGDIAGTIDYRVRASDEHGNVGLSGVKSYVATGCTGNVFTYCTAGTTSSGCNASMGASGVPSVSAASGFVLTASNVEGGKLGLIFYGISGRTATQWGTGTSFVCVKPPVQRSPVTSAGGTPGQCDGAIALDWLAFLAANPTVLGASFSAGQAVDAQCWFRDPPAPKSTSLSDALEFVTCP